MEGNLGIGRVTPESIRRMRILFEISNIAMSMHYISVKIKVHIYTVEKVLSKLLELGEIERVETSSGLFYRKKG
jgi:predicted transcriptional regulator